MSRDNFTSSSEQHLQTVCGVFTVRWALNFRLRGCVIASHCQGPGSIPGQTWPDKVALEQLFLRVLGFSSGTAVAQWLRCCATNRKVAGSIPAGVSGFFIDIKSFRSHYGPGVDSASNRNEYKEYFLGVKAAGA